MTDLLVVAHTLGWLATIAALIGIAALWIVYLLALLEAWDVFVDWRQYRRGEYGNMPMRSGWGGIIDRRRYRP